MLEDGCVTHPESGSPQGGVISPVLANAYLHEVLDTWFERTVKPRLKGRASLIRYADDAVLVFEAEGNARRVLDVLPKRFGEVRPDPPPGEDPVGPVPAAPPGHLAETDRPGTFDFLGFTHHWGRTLKGNWAVKRKTAKDRFSRSLKSMARWCREHRHLPIKEQWVALTGKLRGHFAYYGDHRQYGEGRQLPVPREAGLAEVAQPPLGQGPDRVGAFRRVGAAFPAASGSAEGRPSGHVANSWHEEPDASIGHVRI